MKKFVMKEAMKEFVMYTHSEAGCEGVDSAIKGSKDPVSVPHEDETGNRMESNTVGCTIDGRS